MSDEKMHVDVAIIGGGPAGLAAAITLRKRGIKKVTILERECNAGGIPRHCGHPPFGMREFHRILRGPKYAARVVEQAKSAGAQILTRHSVTELLPGGELKVASPQGLLTISAKRVLIATGVRETPRAARFVTGGRPKGITTTGALQSMIYLKGLSPFKRPVIVGSELVSFSAILTAIKGGMDPVAMIEPGQRITARHPCELIAHFKGVPLLLNTELKEILGTSKVEGITVNDTKTGESRDIDCDGVIFTGKFIPEAALAKLSHLQLDAASGGLEIDQFGRCSDANYYATGNILRPVETAGWSYREGHVVGAMIADDLEGKLSDIKDASVLCRCEDPVKLVVPQRIIPGRTGGFKHLQLRVSRAVKGELIIADNLGREWKKKMSVLPERRILVALSELGILENTGTLRVYFKE